MGAGYYLETYGCQMNVADSAVVEELLGAAGMERVEDPAAAEVILVNTCSVREHAVTRVQGRLASLVGKGGRTKVVGLLGCLAQHRQDGLLERLPFLDIVAGPDSYHRLADMILTCLEGQGDRFVDVKLDRKVTYGELFPTPDWRGAGAFVTVQRGCDRFCSYCVVPLVRGRERSLDPDQVVEHVRRQVEAGYREVTLLGQTVNLYRQGTVGFPDLLRKVARVDGLERIRFLSPHPIGFDDELIEVMATEPKVMPQVHLPLQAGDDEVLARMRRGYTMSEFAALVDRLRAAVPGVAIGTDVMVGFSGETDEQFQRTYQALERLRFHFAYMYRYSEREGTIASRRMPDDVPDEAKAERLERIIALQERISRELLAGYVGREVEVLVDGPSRKNPADRIGMSREGLPVVIKARPALAKGDLVTVAVTDATSHTLVAG